MELGNKKKYTVLKFLLNKKKKKEEKESYPAGFGFAPGLPQEQLQPGLPLVAQASIPWVVAFSACSALL